MSSPLLPRDPTNLGDYTLTGRLGSGGFGVIYEAVAPSGGQVAIKLLNSELSTDPTFRARLAQEGTAMAAVRSDRTAQVIDVVDQNEFQWFTQLRHGSNQHASFNGNPPTLDFELVCFVEADQQGDTYSAEFYVEDSVGNWDRTFWEITVVLAG